MRAKTKVPRQAKAGPRPDPIIEGKPVESFDLGFMWFDGDWKRLFDEQIKLVKNDILRAKMEDRLVVYLSCPISARGGGYSGTNVDVSRFIERRLLSLWGEGIWILNPTQYQMESKAGTGLMNRHAERLNIDLDALLARSGYPRGGDYMRMWTKVLVENGEHVGRRRVPANLVDTGQFFDAYYFIGPSDVQAMFLSSGETLTSGIHEYFARKFAHESDFCDDYSIAGIDWRRLEEKEQRTADQIELRDGWQMLRNDFFRFYALRASANYSLGCHDEWLIFRKLNELRRARGATFENREVGGIGDQIAGFFDGRQIDPAASEMPLSKGYCL
jgi:hypothetical protein